MAPEGFVRVGVFQRRVSNMDTAALKSAIIQHFQLSNLLEGGMSELMIPWLIWNSAAHSSSVNIEMRILLVHQ